MGACTRTHRCSPWSSRTPSRHSAPAISSEKSATPAGFESVRDIMRPNVDRTKSHQDEGLDESTSGHAGPKCNECNEVTPRLAVVAKNALLNGDFPRVIAILDRSSA